MPTRESTFRTSKADRSGASFLREAGLRLALVVVSVLLVGLIGEATFRIAIAAGAHWARNPRLYAGWCDDEDQWKLRYRWIEETRDALAVSGLVHDPEFGWSAPATVRPEPGDAPVLVYGDSFMYGVTKRPRARIPALLGGLLPHHSVLNLAAPAYGFDQIFLRFRETYADFTDPMIVLGIMTLDLDRSLFAVRDAPKPYFRLEGGELQLHGVPVPEDQAAWHREHPPEIKSYFLAFLSRKLRTWGHVYETEIPYRQDAKKRLNRALLESFAEAVHRDHLRHLVVLFYPQWELGYTGWRETFLHDELARLGLEVLDTKQLFLEHGGAQGLYLPAPNEHPNAAANRLIAEEIAARVAAGEGDSDGDASLASR